MSEFRCRAVACVFAALASALPSAVLSQVPAGEELADPMRPSGLPAASTADATPEKAAALPRLQAIMREGRRHSAVVNGQVVHVGDDVGGATVTAITANSITVNVEGKPTVLRLVDQDVKHDAHVTR